MTSELPYLSDAIPAIPCAIKQRHEDFVVEELPLYEPCGEGEHLFIGIEKQGLGTPEAIAWLAARLKIAGREIGAAGMKDARGRTRQTLSLPGSIDAQRVLGMASPKMRVLWARRHTNKLRVGHLRGNRFELYVRGLARAQREALEQVLELLRARGVPNYFGLQRFGARGESGLIGRALLRGDADTAVALLCGRPGPLDRERVLVARQLFERGEYARAADTWPAGFRDPIRVCRRMAASGGDARASVHALDPKMARFYVSAWQSQLFNCVLAERIQTIDQLLPGDIAAIHASGGQFLARDPHRELEAVRRGEISPTGPLFGERMLRPEGQMLAIEQRVLAEQGASEAEFEAEGRFKTSGGRRALRFPLGAVAIEHGSDERGEYARLDFELPPGCYATSVMREVGKQALAQPGDPAQAAEGAPAAD